MKFLLEPAYVLHARHYRETSLIVQFFTENFGIVHALARSARGPRSRSRGYLMPFSPLLISCSGKTDLLQLTAVEGNGSAIFLTGNTLFSGLYLNELILKLIPRHDACPRLFSLYQETLLALQTSSVSQENVLRSFEKNLLAELGYGLQLTTAIDESLIDPEKYYAYFLGRGLMPCQQGSSGSVFQGKHLLAIEKNDYIDTETLRAARKLMRLVIGSLVESDIKTRELFSRGLKSLS